MSFISKRHVITVVIAGFFLAALPAEAGYGHKDWSRYADVAAGNKNAGGFRRLVLPPPVLGRSAPDLSDLRLVTRSGREVPHLLLPPRPNGVHPTILTARVTSISSHPEKGTVFTVDTGRDKLFHGSITLDTGITNFFRPVTVEGSDDALTWKLLTKNSFIFSLPEKNVLAWKTVEYPPSNCRYLRISIANGQDKPLGIDGITVNKAPYVNTPLSGIPIKHFKIVEVPEHHLTKVKLDLGYAHIPLAGLSMYITDPSFIREVMVLGSQDTKRWRRFSGAVIFRNSLSGTIQQKTRLQLPAGTSYRHLMLVIRNDKEKALHIKRVTAYGPQVSLVFRADIGRQYRLFFGKPNTKAPVYDIQQYRSRFLNKKPATASLGPIKARASIAAPLQRRKMDILPAAAGIILLIIFALLLLQLRRPVKRQN
ncbi:MAG: DUF3999 family protein [bacterium]|jgi:hypothetical protein|nr:DUF3999 family protein [bacterium]MDD4153661.1 DUF3999 family protein [bacterium]